MLIDPTRITLRPGNDPRFLNIDYHDKEIGHLKLSTDGLIIEAWAIHYENRPLVELIARCQIAFRHTPTEARQ